jgi:nickel/cobalt transporter (NicO) family protein
MNHALASLTRAIARVLAVALLALVWALLPVASAAAHPLGNFTVNRYSRIEVSADRLRIRYVEDMAEIPTFQTMPDLDRNHDGVVDDAERAAHGAARMNVLVGNLHLTIGGTTVPLQVASHDLELLPGQGGLSTMRLTAWLEATMPATASQPRRPVALAYRDDNEPERVGWREIVLRPADASGVAILEATAPATDLSNELRAYPIDMLTAPLNRRAVSAKLDLGASSSGVRSTVGASATATSLSAPTDALTSLLQQSASLGQLVAAGRLGPSAIALAFLLASLWGAAHALSPGHGKTIVAAYLVGSRGTAWHALYLGLTVTATHTIGIYALGLVTLFAARFILPEKLYPWLALASGCAVVVIGVVLLNQRVRQLRRGRIFEPRTHDHASDHQHGEILAMVYAGHHVGQVHAHAGHHDHGVEGHDHEHSHDDAHDHLHDHGHRHSHDHGHDHGHSHLPPGADGGPVTWRSLLALGIAGGILPCPSALVLLLGAIAIGQVAFGLALVAAFSSGLALVLTGLGIALVYARRLAFGRAISRLEASGRWLRLAPIGSALVIAILGLAMTVEALGQTGLI